MIAERQCKDANDIYEEWRNLSTVCQPKTERVFAPKSFEFDGVRSVANLDPTLYLNPTDFQPVSILQKNADIITSGLDLSASQNEINISSVYALTKQQPLIGKTEKIDLGILPPQINSAGILSDAVKQADRLQGLDQLVDYQDRQEEELQTVEDGVELTMEESDTSACSQLVGWYRLGIPRWNRETCEEYVWNEDFFKCYSHTDKIAHIDKIREDHKTLDDVGSATILKLEVDGVKKILPYNGFYPSQRVVQLGSLFYDSVIPYVEGENDENLFDKARMEQAALQPFFAPGILFNTIKSGIAVDWAAYSSSEQNEDYSLQCLIKQVCEESEKLTDPVQIRLQKVVASEIFSLNALGRINTTAEKIQAIKDSYVKNSQLLTAELNLTSKSAVRVADQQEYEKFAQVKNLDPRDNKTADQFRSAYSKHDFEPNKISASLSVSSETKSILGLPKNTTLTTSSLVDAAQKTTNMLSSFSAGIKPISLVDLTAYSKSLTLLQGGLEEFLNQHNYKSNGRYLNKAPNFRIPFEGLLSLESYLPQKNSDEESKIFLLAPSYYESDDQATDWKYPYFEWSGEKSPLYEMAMSNFLAEVPNFFLSQGKFTTFASAPENKFKTVRKGWTYYMDIHLYKTDDFDMTISPHDGQLRKIGADSAGREFTTQGRYYGPAVRYFDESNSRIEANASADPAQAPYVPPYFYGRAKARLSYTATMNGKPSLDEILNNLEIDYINEEMDELFASRSSSGEYLASSIFKTAIGQQPPPWKKTPAYTSRMPMGACIKFDGRTNEKKISFAAINTANDFTPDGVARLSPRSVEDDNQNTGVWVISPRFECPTFNFKTPENLNYRDENNCGTGIWGGYGTIPVQTDQKEQGLFISIEESFKRHEMVGKPVKCRRSPESIYSVALGIGMDTRNLTENVIILKDPKGNSYPITIGQPSQPIDRWDTGEISEFLSKKVGIGNDTKPYNNVLIRTVATSPKSSKEDPKAGMYGEYDIEAYLQSEAIMTDAFQQYAPKAETVPKGADVANAIVYHINYKNDEERTEFPWRANIIWVNTRENSSLRGAAKTWRDNRNKPQESYTKIATSLSAVVQIQYIPPEDTEADTIRSVNGIFDEIEPPTIDLISNADPLKNPRGLLGLRYLSDKGVTDYLLSSQEPQSQLSKTFYKKDGTNYIVECLEAVGSLIDVCGFTATKSRIGEVAPSKEISEAVVMIPFVDNPIESQSVASTTQVAGKNFFQISEQLFSETKANVEAGNPAISTNGVYRVAADISKTSVSEMIKKMQKYNLPPQFDFLKYREINPFVMYIFEFKESLDSEDLSNIWQGLMPERARTAEREVVTIEHEMNQINFFEGKKTPENIRWMVFRVKKKAKTNYWEMTADSIDDDRFKFDFKFGTNLTPDYSYNWPYDFFSLVELCKIKGGISVVPRAQSLELDTSERIDFEPIISTEQRRRLIDDAHAQAAISSKEVGIGLFNNLLDDEDE